MPRPALRERKKARTRQAIVNAALDLYASRGFETTTVADIAAAADVAPATFFTYFRTKEDVVFWDFDARFASLRHALEDRPAGEHVIDALRKWFETQLARAPVDLARERQQASIIARAPSVAARSLQLFERLEALIASALADELEVASDDVVALLPAAAATAWLRALGRLAIDAGPHSEIARAVRDDPMQLLMPVFRFIEAGIAAIRTPGSAQIGFQSQIPDVRLVPKLRDQRGRKPPSARVSL
jgi:AcrR family transcriptional regulator